MTKAEFLEALKKSVKLELSKVALQEIVDTTFEEVSKAIRKDKKFTMPGFGTFKVRLRKARVGKNPKTGEAIKIKASKTVAFKPAPALKGKL